jgi:hypothetical protein
VSLEEDSSVEVAFGSVMDDTVVTALAAAEAVDAAAADLANQAAIEEGSDPLGILVVLAAVVAVLLLVGVIIIIFRGRSASS